MISPSEWKSSVVYVLRRIADEAYQNESWFGHGKESSSPDEMMCQIFDDVSIVSFIESKDIDISKLAKSAVAEFISAIQEFSDATPVHLDPAEVINDGRWQIIRKLAQRAADLVAL